MARIRSIKPEYWTDSRMVSLPMEARLFYIGCWNFADDYGVLEDDPVRLKLQILPADDVDAVAIVDMLVSLGRLRRMAAPNGDRVLVIGRFSEHQRIDKRAAGRWGDPSTFEPAQSPPIPPTPSDSRAVPTNPAPVVEGKGGEGIGEENTRGGNASSTALALVPHPSSPPATAFEDFWCPYPRKVARQAAEKAWRRLKPREKAEAVQAAAGYAAVVQRKGTASEHVLHGATFLNQRRWLDYLPGGPGLAEARTNGQPTALGVLERFVARNNGGVA